MNKFKFKSAYSIAEALVTLLIVAIIFVAIAPNLVGKRPKLKNYFHSNHGIFTCTGQAVCNFPLPKDVKDIFVIAVGGGGGGAGAYCSSSNSYYSGDQEKDVTGKWSFVPGRAVYVDASSSSGGSWYGNCKRYPGDFVPSQHAYDCNVYPDAYYYERHYSCDQGDEIWRSRDQVWNEEKKQYVWEYEWYTPKRYEWDKNNYRTDGKYDIHCDYNKSTSRDCGDWTSGQLSSNCNYSYDFYHDFYRGTSLEDKNKGSGTCSTNWLLKPEVNDPKRGCDAKVFGGRGGNGWKYTARICPEPKPETCLQWRQAHSVGTGCTAKDIAAGKKWMGESYPQNKQCGHPYGAWGCIEPHKGAVSKKCMIYSDEGTKISYSIGKPGTARGGAANPLEIVGYTTKSGGAGGKANTNPTGDGVSGGGHNGMSLEYSTYSPVTKSSDNTLPGKPGYINFEEKYIAVGDGGSAGKMKAGYFKNVKGPITITVGAGGTAGLNGGEGGDGGTTTVKAAKGGFSVATGAGTPATGGNMDKGSSDGTLFSVPGGAGGTHSTYYEQCDGDNEHGGGSGEASKIQDFGKGGNGNGGIVPGCARNDGSPGNWGGVIIFY